MTDWRMMMRMNRSFMSRNGDIMNWDRFDIVEAHYWFCADYHTGQACPLYARLGRIQGYYRPSPLQHGPAGPNAQAIYDALCMKLEQAQCGAPTENRMMGLS